MNTYTHTISCLTLENYSMSLHELADIENLYDNQTISYESTRKFNNNELIGVLEDHINADLPDYCHVSVSYAELKLTDSSAFALAF